MDISRLLPLIGVAIFIAVLLNVDLPEMLNSIAGASPPLLLLAAFVHIPLILMKAGKWKLITHAFGSKAPLSRFMQAWLVGFVTGIATPGRIGEFSKACYLRERVSMGRALASIAVDRAIDIAVLFVLAILGAALFIYVYGGFIHAEIMVLMAVLFAAFLASVSLVLARGDIVKRFARPLFRRFVPGRYKPGMKTAFREFYAGLGEIMKARTLVASSAVLSALSWLVIVFQCSLISMAISLRIDYAFLLSVIPVVTLLDALPVSVSGLGTRELALIFFLGIISIPMGAAVAFSILIFLLNYMLLVPFGLILWMVRPVKIRP
jgi:uncharacterized protein (TIRG00374 family)